jgi:hypothetical protein
MKWSIRAFRESQWKRRDGRSLSIQLWDTGDRYAAFAVEVATAGIGSVDAVLEDHGHKMIGTWSSELAAQRGAEAFAKRWQKSRKSVEACACEEIATFKRKKAA